MLSETPPGDGAVKTYDLAQVLGNCRPRLGCPADGDGLVGPFDLAVLLESWGPCS